MMRRLSITAFVGFAQVLLADNPFSAESDTSQFTSAFSEAGIHFRVLDKTTNQKFDLKSRVNASLKIGNLEIIAYSCFSPPPENAHEATAYVKIVDKKEEKATCKENQGCHGSLPHDIYRNWMFASSPAVNSFEHPQYHVTVVTCLKEQDLEPKSSSESAQ